MCRATAGTWLASELMLTKRLKWGLPSLPTIGFRKFRVHEVHCNYLQFCTGSTEHSARLHSLHGLGLHGACPCLHDLHRRLHGQGHGERQGGAVRRILGGQAARSQRRQATSGPTAHGFVFREG